MYIYEHLLAKMYGWDLNTIRNMDYYDFQAHLEICIVAEDIEIELRAKLAGIDTSKKRTSTLSQNKFIMEENISL